MVQMSETLLDWHHLVAEAIYSISSQKPRIVFAFSGAQPTPSTHHA
jgi:hypothetical protein